MVRSPALPGVVAPHHRFLLLATERLHRRIDVEYPRFGEKRRRAIIKMTPQPGAAFFFIVSL
jgi:hypothetical protein